MIRKQLAVDYAVSVIKKGVACCEHTCNNPLLNQMVVSIISLPGVLSPEMVEQFKIAIEQMAGKTLKQQVDARKALQQRLTAPVTESTPNRAIQEKKETNSEGDTAREVEGYAMEKMASQDETSEVSSSGVEWFAALAVLVLIALVFIGARRNTL